MEREIKAVLTDIDGVWTDGRIYLNEEGKSFKAFNTHDSVGVSLLRLVDIPVIIITGEDSEIIRHRAEKLNINHVYTGVRNKLFIAEKTVKDLGIELSACAYAGDDLSDLPLLKAVGLSAVPANAAEFLKNEVSCVLTRNGGEGAFREFCELILKENGLFEKSLESYFDRIAKSRY